MKVLPIIMVQESKTEHRCPTLDALVADAEANGALHMISKINDEMVKGVDIDSTED